MCRVSGRAASCHAHGALARRLRDIRPAPRGREPGRHAAAGPARPGVLGAGRGPGSRRIRRLVDDCWGGACEWHGSRGTGHGEQGSSDGAGGRPPRGPGRVLGVLAHEGRGAELLGACGACGTRGAAASGRGLRRGGACLQLRTKAASLTTDSSRRARPTSPASTASTNCGTAPGRHRPRAPHTRLGAGCAATRAGFSLTGTCGMPGGRAGCLGDVRDAWGTCRAGIAGREAAMRRPPPPACSEGGVSRETRRAAQRAGTAGA